MLITVREASSSSPLCFHNFSSISRLSPKSSPRLRTSLCRASLSVQRKPLSADKSWNLGLLSRRFFHPFQLSFSWWNFWPPFFLNWVIWGCFYICFSVFTKRVFGIWFWQCVFDGENWSSCDSGWWVRVDRIVSGKNNAHLIWSDLGTEF